MAEYEKDNNDYWEGLTEVDWLTRAEEKMEYIYSAVRRKGRFGGVIRQELYHQPYKDKDNKNRENNDQKKESFWNTVAALQAITERLVQSTSESNTRRFTFARNKDDQDTATA